MSAGRRILAALLMLMFGALAGCDPMGGAGAGSEYRPEADPDEPDFDVPSPAPADRLGAFAVRAQAYNADGEPIGGVVQVYINATAPPDPRIQGGREGAHGSGPFPLEIVATGLPYQFPIYVAPGIPVLVEATFRAFLDAHESLQCWLVDHNGVELFGTRAVDDQGERGLAEVNCVGSVGA